MIHPLQNRCTFTDGGIALPVGFREQTINIMPPGKGISLNISSDVIRTDGNFTSWPGWQRGLMQKATMRTSGA